VFADVNGDGWLDLLVGSVSQGVFCFLNDQRGHFTNATTQAGTASPTQMKLALADIDGNGTLISTFATTAMTTSGIGHACPSCS
jgi:hypothetical protein